MDYAALLYGPIYDQFGVSAQLTPSGSTSAVPVVAIDKTKGVDVSGAMDIWSLRPAAIVRMQDLTDQGVTLSEIDGARIGFNGKSWLIDSHYMKPSPHGEASGEVMLFLTDESAYG